MFLKRKKIHQYEEILGLLIKGAQVSSVIIGAAGVGSLGSFYQNSVIGNVSSNTCAQ